MGKCDYCAIAAQLSMHEKERCHAMTEWGAVPLHCSLAELRMVSLIFARTIGKGATKVFKMLPKNWISKYNK